MKIRARQLKVRLPSPLGLFVGATARMKGEDALYPLAHVSQKEFHEAMRLNPGTVGRPMLVCTEPGERDVHFFPAASGAGEILVRYHPPEVQA